MASQYERMMSGTNVRPAGTRDPMAVMNALQAQLVSSQQTQDMKAMYDEVSRYYDNPRAYSNDKLEALRRMGATYGIEIPLGAKDKATALENIGAGIVGALDSMLFDMIPDDYYSSRRTATARAIGNWAGILVPAVIATVGSGGMAVPGVVAALGKTAMKGTKAAALKLGGRKGVQALRSAEQGASRVISGLGGISPGAIAGSMFGARAVRGAGQALSKFGPTAGVGERIVSSSVGQKGAKQAAEKVLNKASKFAKKGDAEGLQDALAEVGDDIAPFLGDATESLIKSGKVKGVAADVLKQATSKFGATNFADDALDDIAKGFMGYKKGGKAARGHASKFMDSLREGLSKGDNIEDIIKASGIPKARGTAIRKMYKDPDQRAELLRKLAENNPSTDASLFSSMMDVGKLAGLTAFEGSMMGSSEILDDGLPL